MREEVEGVEEVEEVEERVASDLWPVASGEREARGVEEREGEVEKVEDGEERPAFAEGLASARLGWLEREWREE